MPHPITRHRMANVLQIMYNEAITWDTTLAGHSVSYSFEIYNQGKVSVEFYGLAVVEQVLRSAPKDNSQRLYIDDTIYHKTLYPDHYCKFSGKLDYWQGQREYISDFAPGDMSKFMPQLVLPGAENSFYWTFNSDSLLLRNQRTEVFDTHFEQTNNFNADDVIDLIFSVVPYRSDLFSYACGMGYGVANNIDHIWDHEISYSAIFNDEGRIYSKGKYFPVVYGIKLFTSRNKKIEYKQLDELVQDIKKLFPNLDSKDTTSDERRVVAFYEKGQPYLTIESYLNTPDSNYDLTLNIIGLTMVAPDSLKK